MADNKNGYTFTNKGAQEIKAPKKQPKCSGISAKKGTDLRGGK